MRRAIFSILFLLLLTAAVALIAGPLRSAKSAVNEFYRPREVGEDQIADPLILTGCRAAPIIARDLSNRNMPYRRYAIGYLGNRRCEIAVPILRKIIADPTEREYFRGDALEAIYRIERSEGLKLAHHHSREQNYLGERARNILGPQQYLGSDRTFWEALRGTHE